MHITGTFLDEITHDIPSQNWGKREWARDFDAMKAMGIDTVILIRAGYRDQCVFDSEVLAKHRHMRPAYIDLLQVFLDEAARCGMSFWFGTYDSGQYWINGQAEQEVALNQAFTEEVIRKYGDHPAWGGWYVSHEIATYDEGVMHVYESLANHLRQLKPLPILISPYIKGVMQFGTEAISLGSHIKEWKSVFERLEGVVDIVAFQDGNVPLDELPDYLAANAELASAHGLTTWSNVESFERGHPIKFLPLDYRKMRYKMESAASAGVDKLITFEFSHFMSPNSMYGGAHGLYRQLMDWKHESA